MKNVKSSVDYSTDSNGVLELVINSKCAGIYLDIGLNEIESVSVSLMSSALRDKLHYELKGSTLKNIFNETHNFSKNINTDGSIEDVETGEDGGYYIPFAVGNLEMSDDNSLKVIVKFKKKEGESPVFKVPVHKVIFASNASQPIVVKNLSDVESFDSAYYKKALIFDMVGVQYYSKANQKVSLPYGFMTIMNTYHSRFLTLVPNTEYQLSSLTKVWLLDY